MAGNNGVYVSGSRMASLLEGRDLDDVKRKTGLSDHRLRTLMKAGPHGMRGTLVTAFCDALGMSTFMFLERVELEIWAEQVTA